MSDIDADQPERELAAYTRHRDDLLVRIVGVLQFMLAMAYSPSLPRHSLAIEVWTKNL